jgi:transcriptional regulator with XRE-family HTH domain
MVATAHDLNRERHWLCARRISDRRHALGLTQTDVVSRLAALGTAATNRTLSAIEHGQGVDVGRLPELAVALDCSITYLLGLTEDPGDWTPDEARLPDYPDGSGAVLRRGATGGQNGHNVPHVSWILGPEIPEPWTAAGDEPPRA